MITNFEEITADLNETDLFFQPFVFDFLRDHVGAKKAIKSPNLVESINKIVVSEYGQSVKRLTDVRLRKIVNYLRSHGLSPICATSDGYFITFENKVLLSQVKSMEERANGILIAAKGLKKWIH